MAKMDYVARLFAQRCRVSTVPDLQGHDDPLGVGTDLPNMLPRQLAPGLEDHQFAHGEFSLVGCHPFIKSNDKRLGGRGVRSGKTAL